MRNFKKIAAVAGAAAVVICVLLALDFLLYPCTFIRNDIHAVTEKAYDDIFMGASYGKINIDPSTMQEETGRTGYNLCVGGEYTVDTYFLTKLMLEKGCKPQRIVYEVSPGYFVREKEEGNNYLLFYHEFPVSLAKLDYFRTSIMKCNLRTLFFPWYEYPLFYELAHAGETVRKKWSRDYGGDGFQTATQEWHEDGFIERYPVDPEELTLDGYEEMFPEEILPENMEYLEKTIALCREKGIEFVAISTPLPEDSLEAFSDGYEALGEYYAQFFEEQDVRYINFNSNANYHLADHGKENYTDLDGHMNGDAARVFSATLAKVLEAEDGLYEEEAGGALG